MQRIFVSYHTGTVSTQRSVVIPTRRLVIKHRSVTNQDSKAHSEEITDFSVTNSLNNLQSTVNVNPRKRRTNGGQNKRKSNQPDTSIYVCLSKNGVFSKDPMLSNRVEVSARPARNQSISAKEKYGRYRIS